MTHSFQRLPNTLYSAEQARELDRIAIEDFKILGYTLMHSAAVFSYHQLEKKWPDAKSITVICGGGNNAGDGYVLAGLAKEDGKDVTVFYLQDPKKLKDDAATAYKFLQASNVKASKFSVSSPLNSDVIVDAIFGTGLDRNIEGEFADAINLVNVASAPVLSMDIPSGLNADTGCVMNVAVKAELTTTFIALKKGMFTADAPEYSGEIKFYDLDVPEKAYEQVSSSISKLKIEDLNQVLKPRQQNSHKGHFGHVLVIGGDKGYLGAARMAGEAAARVGAGLVSIATRESHAGLLSTIRPEIMSHGVETLDELLPLVKQANVIAIGPGLGQSEWAKLLLARVLESELPIIIDADALNLLTKEDQASANWVITPHPGEAARLLNIESAVIQADRFKAIQMLKEKYKGPVVLKGSGTLVLDTEGKVFTCGAGNPGMSSGGMGDVLTGVIAGLIAQGIEINHATKLGVYLHASAADRAAAAGERGMLAMDLMPHLRNLVN